MKQLRWLALVWAYLECIGFSGIIFGWGSLVYVLKDEGLYRELCGGDKNIVRTSYSTSSNITSSPLQFDDDYDPYDCDARDDRFALVFTIANVFMGAGVFVLGMISLRFGTRVTRLVGTVIFILGSLCLALASTDNPWLIFLGLPLTGLGGLGVMATNIQVSFLFPVWGSAVSSLLSGAFDASASIQLLVKIGYENGISRSTSYTIMTCVFVLTLFNTFFLLPKKFYQKAVVSETSVNAEKDEKDEKENGGLPPLSVEEEEETKKIQPQSFVQILKSPQFILHLFWFILLHLRNIYYQASINSVLEETFDTDDEVSDYTNIYMYILLSGTVVSFLPGLVYDYNVKWFQKSKSPLERRLMPCVMPLIMTSFLGNLLSLVAVFTGPVSIYVEFVLVVFLRAFAYSTMVTYLRHMFPSEYFTTLYGIIIFVGNIIVISQYAFFVWASSHGFSTVNIFMTVLIMLTLVHPGFQWMTCRRARRAGT